MAEEEDDWLYGDTLTSEFHAFIFLEIIVSLCSI